MKIDGQCHCGAVRVEGEVDPKNTIICHCTDCQRISGGPYRLNVAVATHKLALTGTLQSYMKRGDSGAVATTKFCPVCGTAVYSCKGEAPAFVFLRYGMINQRADLPPQRQGFCSSALPWASDITGVPAVGPA